MVKTKNILIISAANPYKSSGIVALDLLNGLSQFEDNKVKLLTKHCKSDNPNVIAFLNPVQYCLERIANKFRKILYKLNLKENYLLNTNPDYHVLDFDQTKTFYKTEQILKKAKFQPSHIIILFTYNFVSYKNIYELNKTTGAPIYLYPMDMAPFTGGCHYAWDCVGYQNQCGNCPAIYSTKLQDHTNINHSYKMEFMQKTDVSLFAANSQIAYQIKHSTIFKNKIIHEGIFPVPDKNIFKKLSKNEVRNFFNIDQNEVVLFFGAVSLSEKRKGMQILLQGLNIVYKKLIESGYDINKITLLVAGNNLNYQLNETAFEIKHLGFITDYALLAKAYNAADYFICPSIEEAGPTMILQSILCGTPSICFNTGYAADYIKDEVNGYIIFEKNSIALSEAIIKAIKLPAPIYSSMKNEVKITSKKINQNIILKNITDIITNKTK